METLAAQSAPDSSAMQTLSSLHALHMGVMDAYASALERLEDDGLRDHLKICIEDHRFQSDSLKEIIGVMPQPVEIGMDTVTEWYNKGKLMFAELLGDGAMLSAIKDQENDICAAYTAAQETLIGYDGAAEIVNRGIAAAHRHRSWLESAIDPL